MRRLHKKWIAGLLLFILAGPFAVRHIHLDRCCHIGGNDADAAGKPVHHHSETCPVCQFVLSPFTETEPGEFDFTPCRPSPEPAVYQEKRTRSRSYGYFLRAPPCA
ncbi:MAG: hypothetical protein LBP50_05405 [Tannerella sp.]|nr:hypothetical protein [Tannerella sp.]